MGATTAGLNIAFTFSNGISLNLLESTASMTKMGGVVETLVTLQAVIIA